MLGFFTAIYSGLILVFACIGVVFVGYKLYQYFKGDAKNTAPNQEFENIRRERLEREDAVSQFVRQSNLHLHHHAHQAVARFKDQQAHLEKSITDFDAFIEQAHRTNSDLNETNSSLQNSIILPMQTLLVLVKAHFQSASSLVLSLSAAMPTATKSVEDREHELRVVIQNLDEVESSLRNVKLKAEYVTKIEEENRTLVSSLVGLTEKAAKLFETNKRQRRIIELLQAKNQSDAASHDCRLFGARSPSASIPIDSDDELDPRPTSTELRNDTALMV